MKIKYLLIVSLLFISHFSLAKTVLKQINATKDNRVELSFSEVIRPSQVKTEYVNDILQLTLDRVNVYPAKMAVGRGEVIKKIFAYQYSPGVVRCRLTLNGKAESFKNSLNLGVSGKTVSLGFESGPVAKLVNDEGSKIESLKVESKKLENSVTEKPIEKAVTVNDISEKNRLSDEDQVLVDRIVNKKSAESPSLTAPADSSEKQSSLSLIRTALLKMMGVLFLFILCIGVLVKYKPAILSAIGGSAGFHLLDKSKGKEKLIEVVASHRLDPKKNIMVVRVGKRQYVLGTSSDSIHLISEFKKEASVLGEEEDDPDSFSDIFGNERGKPLESSIRARIKSRLEGLKPL